MNNFASALAALAPEEGVNQTKLDGVKVFKASTSTSREPLCYSQGIVIIAQGAKRVFLGEQSYDYNPQNYLVLTLPIPAECETHVEPGKPLLALAVDIDLTLLHSLVRLIHEHQPTPAVGGNKECGHSLYVCETTQAMEQLLLRLVDCLNSELKAKALGKGLVKELLFYLLASPKAAPLFALAQHNTHVSRLEPALKYMHNHYQQSLDVSQLAELSSMSASSFHRVFRQLTASSPIQYLKVIRLSRAKELLQDQGLKVKQAAAQVGYESTTQFSREFKRYFGHSPQQTV